MIIRRGFVPWGTWCLGLIAWGAAFAAEDPLLVAPTDPLPAAEQLKKFRLPPGFEIQLVAAEPDIRKPMNMNFDAAGRLWVTGSVEYPFPVTSSAKPRDTVRVFERFGPDGHAGKVTVFADGLNIPIGVLPVSDGAIVYGIPEIRHLVDADRDGVSERRETYYQKFGSRDTHGMSSSYTYWLDGWVYACHGFANDSEVSGANGLAIQMNSGNTYRFRADGSAIEYYTHGQVNPFGMCFDPLGNVYTADCHSMPIYMLLRGAYYPSFGKPDDGLGYGPTMLNHNHGSTGICGVVYYAADHFPPPYHDTVFIGNPVTGRINHDRLETRGATYWCVEQPDFLSCDDPWFRPVDIKLGPDGALYIADFYNKIIGHYEVDLRHPGRDRERGRIWRIVYKGNTAAAPAMPNLATASADQLIAALDSPNLTMRVTATQQLVDRIGAAAVEPLASLLTRKKSSGFQRAHGLWAIERLKGLSPELVASAAGDGERLVRVHLMKALGERKTWEPAVAELVVGKLDDPDAFVRRAAADALGRHARAEQVEPLIRLLLATPPHDTHLIHVVRMALRDQLAAPGVYPRAQTLAEKHANPLVWEKLANVSLGVPGAAAGDFVAAYLRSRPLDPGHLQTYLRHAVRWSDEGRLTPLVEWTAALRERSLPEQVAAIRGWQQGSAERGRAFPTPLVEWSGKVTRQLLAAKNPGEIQQGIELARDLRLADAHEDLARIARDAKAGGLRVAAIDACVAVDARKSPPLLAGFLTDGHQPLDLRQKAAQALGAINDDSSRAELLQAIVTAPEPVAVAIGGAVSGSRPGGEALLALITQGKVSPRLLQEAAVKDRLRRAQIPGVDEQIAKLTAALPPQNQRLAELIRARLAGFGRSRADVAAGQQVFQKQCAICHRLGGQGTKIGPELDGVGNRGLERLLEDVLDPSRNVDQAFRGTQVVTKGGQSLSGLLLRTEGEVLILADNQGKEIRLPNSDVAEQAQSNLSPMPANVAELVAEPDFYHLVAYLLSQRQTPPSAGK